MIHSIPIHSPIVKYKTYNTHKMVDDNIKKEFLQPFSSSMLHATHPHH